MAKKDQKIKDKGKQNKLDADVIADLCKDFISGRYSEDMFLAALDGLTKKLIKQKKFKGYKENAKEVEISVSDKVTEIQRSYIKQFANQIKKDLGIQVYLKF